MEYLTDSQRGDVVRLIELFPSLVRDTPGSTNQAVHDVDTENADPVKQHPYRLPPCKKLVVQVEEDYMMRIGVIEPSDSAWSSPVILVAPEGRADRFFVDSRWVNVVTKGDCVPSPSVRGLHLSGGAEEVFDQDRPPERLLLGTINRKGKGSVIFCNPRWAVSVQGDAF